jgi:hypothetical protein
MTTKSTMTFQRPFSLSGFDGWLPAGTYEVESEQVVLNATSLPDCLQTWVVIHLHSTDLSPALAQTLTVPREVLERAQARDEAPEDPPSDLFLAGMLADPIVRLLMVSDGVSTTEVVSVVKAARAFNPLQASCVNHSKHARLPCNSGPPPLRWITRCDRKSADWYATDRGENEGMTLLPA